MNVSYASAFSKGAYLIRGFVAFLIFLVCTLVVESAFRTKLPASNFYKTYSSLERNLEHGSVSALPDVLIFRRTRKTGSSSMLEQLLKVANQHHYTPLYESGIHLRTLVKAENSATNPKRVFVAEHNSISRADVGNRRAVIVDTVADGYKQITSFCRFVPKVRVRDCEQGLEECLQGKIALSENWYRWAGRENEDAETYIDIPLSVEHPALSTRVFRRVFPDAVLDVRKLNVANSSCDESSRLRSIYNELYRELDRQVKILQLRLLVLAGYPMAKENSSISTAELLEAAEQMERARFSREGLVFGTYDSEKAVSSDHMLLKKSQRQWVRLNGKLQLESARN